MQTKKLLCNFQVTIKSEVRASESRSVFAGRGNIAAVMYYGCCGMHTSFSCFYLLLYPANKKN